MGLRAVLSAMVDCTPNFKRQGLPGRRSRIGKRAMTRSLVSSL